MSDRPKKTKDPSLNHSYRADFVYKSRNPYNQKLDLFEEFVLKDNMAEELPNKWNKEVFNRDAKLMAEIGTGFGHFMLEFCEKNPDVNFVGLDYRFKRSFNLARKLSKLENRNFKYLRAMGERISFIFGEQELDRIFYFFPDPWPKARHNKKRLFQKPFLDGCHKTLKPGGEVFVKTDHDGYFEWMLDVLKDEDRFEVLLQTWDLHQEYPTHFLSQYITKFEKIFMKKEIPTKALVLRKK